jgi:putative hydrolase of the HAD superfamily
MATGELLAGVEAVFFDAVGTLIHPAPAAGAVYAEVGRRFGSRRSAADIAARFTTAFRAQEAYDQARGQATSEAREVERWRQIVTDVLDDVTNLEACFQELFRHFGAAAAWRCEAGTGRVLAELARRGLILGLASNYDGRLRPVVAGLPELTPIQHLAISSEIGWRKPAAHFFAGVCRLVNRPADRILLVGDDLVNDYDGALAAGLKALLYDPNRRAARNRIQSLDELL